MPNQSYASQEKKPITTLEISTIAALPSAASFGVGIAVAHNGTIKKSNAESWSDFNVQDGVDKPTKIYNLVNLQASSPLNNEYQLMAQNHANALATNFQAATWQKIIAGAGSHSYALDATSTYELMTSAVTGATQRASAYMLRPFTAGRKYLFAVYVEAVTGAVNEPWLYTNHQEAELSSGTRMYAGTPVAGNWYGIVFTPNVTTTTTRWLSVGCGAYGNTLPTTAGSIQVSRPIWLDITDMVDGVFPIEWTAAAVNGTDKLPAGRFLNGGTSGLITIDADPLPANPAITVHAASKWLAIGNSYASAVDCYPDRLGRYSKYHVNGAGYSGEMLQQSLTTKLAANLKQNAYDGVILCESVLNNLTADHTLAQMQGYLRAWVAILKASGIKTNKLIITNSPGFKNSTALDWTAGRAAVQASYNAWLALYCRDLGAQYVDIYTALGTPGNLDAMLPTLTADGKHPNKLVPGDISGRDGYGVVCKLLIEAINKCQ